MIIYKILEYSNGVFYSMLGYRYPDDGSESFVKLDEHLSREEAKARIDAHARTTVASTLVSEEYYDPQV